MKKIDEKLNNKILCESCRHIMCELGKIENQEEQRNFENNSTLKCELCGQNIIPENSENVVNKDISLLESALKNPNLKVVGFTAPSVRVALGDMFDMPLGENVEGKMVSGLKKLGFYRVFDMNTAADFTVVEEAKELKERLEKNQNLPVFTSCCPGWINFATKLYPEIKNNLSTVKSPQQIFGALINNYFAENENLKSTDMFVVSIVPCLAKKSELLNHKFDTNVGQDVDVAITTKELGIILKNHGIDIKNIEDQKFDSFFGSASGAGAIFGNTGGVTEAIIRSYSKSFSQKNTKTVDYKMVRGFSDIKEATIDLGERKINVCVVIGLKNVGKIIEQIKEDPEKYQFVEVMACEGGCIGGAGQPRPITEDYKALLAKRAKSLYESEIKKPIRCSHENPTLEKIYGDYLCEIGGKKAKQLLHRDYE